MPAPALPAFVLPAILLLAVLAAGCGGEAPGDAAADERAADRDDLGRPVVLEAVPQRVVTLAPSLTEVVFAAGAGHRLVGVTTADDYPPAVDTLARFGALPVDFEAIAALRPDLVLATDQVNSLRDADTFDALGIPTAFLRFEGLADVERAIRRVGAWLGTRPAADAAADSLAAAAAALRARTDTLAARPRVLFLIGDETLFAFGAGSYVHELVTMAGGESITADIPTAAPILSEEYVLNARPDVILGAWGTDYDVARLAELHPSWTVVPAVQQGRVHSLDGDLLLRPGPRLVEGARRMAEALHPDLFAAPAPAEAVAR